MPILDLSLVTTTFLRLLRMRVTPLWEGLFPPAPPLPPAVTYTGASTAGIGSDNTLAFFLFHAGEDAQFKNQPPVFRDRPPVRFTPMGLVLQYQMVTHTAAGVDVEAAVVRAQRLFGLGLKTLHDYPSIDKNTEIGGFPVFPPELQGTDDLFRVTLRSVSTNEATGYWTAGTQPVQLAAYYEVSATLLQPDRPQMRSARVLRYGVQLFVNGAPRLDTSRSKVVFRLPGETTDRSAVVQSGEAAFGEEIDFDGTDLNGDVTTLLIKRVGWDEPQEVAADWGVVAGGDTIIARVQNRAGSEDIVPGVYSAAARVTRNRAMPDGSTRAFAQISNDVPFTVAPSITIPPYDGVATAVANIVTVTGGVFQHANVVPESVRVIVGGEPVPIEPTPALTAGHFEIVDATHLRVQFPIAGLTSGDVLPLRVIVNGAENAPRWVRVP
jgi:Pvc16 N-terminal domain